MSEIKRKWQEADFKVKPYYVPNLLQVLLHGFSLPAAGSGSKLCDGAGHVCTLLWRGPLWQAGQFFTGCSELHCAV